MRFRTKDQTFTRYWDDLRFPAGLSNLPGLGSDPDFDTTNGGYLFDGSGTEVLFFQAQLPHSWAQETLLSPHVHWQKTTSASGTVKWQIDYKWAPIGEVMDAAFTTDSTTETVGATPDNDTANEHLISAFTDISGLGKTISDMMLIKISRIGGDDTYAADARLLEFDIHFQKNGFGSVIEFSKTESA